MWSARSVLFGHYFDCNGLKSSEKERTFAERGSGEGGGENEEKGQKEKDETSESLSLSLSDS